MKQVLNLTLLIALILLGACDARQVESHEHATEPPGVASEASEYTCPMHPHYVATDPNGSCPICGMDLVPVNSNSAAIGDGTIVVSSEIIQTMGVRLVPVTTASFGRSVSAFGNVEANERLETVAVARLEGWIENLAVTAVGDTVRSGQLLYRVYSPDLVAAQKDFINSLEIGNPRRIASVRQRLISLGMQAVTVDRLADTRNVIQRIPIYAEASGTVSELSVRGGDYLKPGTPIITLQSYSDVWVIASVSEKDLALISEGTLVALSFPSAPTAPQSGTVAYIYPTIDTKTRTARVRVEVDNSDGSLRPGAYADLDFQINETNRLSIPSEAILRDGRGEHVIVALGEGRFAARQIRSGLNAGGQTEILSGLTDGENVVASGQFLLDSEVNLREGFSKFDAPVLEPMRPDTPLSRLPIDAQTLPQIDHYVDMALYFHEALIDDYRIDPYFVDPALQIGDVLKVKFANTKLTPVLENASSALRVAQTVRSGEPLATELARLMLALEPWLIDGAPSHYDQLGLALFRDTASGQLWLQERGAPQNPYGSKASEQIAWPDPMAALTDQQMQERPADRDPHVGHN